MSENVIFGNMNETNVTKFKKCGYRTIPKTDKRLLSYRQEIAKFGIIIRDADDGIYQTKDKSGHYHLNVKGANQVKNVRFGFKNGWMSLAKMLYIIRNYKPSQFQYIADIML